jgi:hypothetical protein
LRRSIIGNDDRLISMFERNPPNGPFPGNADAEAAACSFARLL